jgi:RNA recognition motif-containing protein
MATVFAGNLPYDVTDDELRQLFEQYGRVTRAGIAVDHAQAGRSKGFGFIEMPIEREAEAAISDLNGREWCGRLLHVDRAVRRVRPLGERAPLREMA